MKTKQIVWERQTRKVSKRRIFNQKRGQLHQVSRFTDDSIFYPSWWFREKNKKNISGIVAGRQNPIIIITTDYDGQSPEFYNWN